MAKNEKIVGYVTVDAGIIQIGDPCYQYEDHEKWIKYIESTGILGMRESVSVPHDATKKPTKLTPGKAVVVGSGMGDGIYPVYVKLCPKTGVVMEAKIKFL